MIEALLTSIQQHLDHVAQPNRLRDLFAQTLNWGKPQGNGIAVPASAQMPHTLLAQPVAQLGSLPVFQITWPEDRLPNVTQRRAIYHMLSPVAFEHVLCYVTQDGQRVAFVWARDQGGKRVELRTLPYEQRIPAHTTLERLAALAFRLEEFDMFGYVTPAEVVKRLNAAFDVEAVTKQFFATYRQCFEHAESRITGIRDPEARRLFTQKLFNRLMFIVFLERKGWLTYNGRHDYLRALWQAHQQERLRDPSATFFVDRLKLLFFAGLNTPHEVNIVDIQHGGVLAERIGQVQYLNGGLFEEEADDKNDAIVVPDQALEEAITDLFYRFNFTISESTPFDIEVAVDPEMLGKVFEELVTGRHTSGSYYTPRPIVAFMCREGLKGYLQAKLPRECAEAIAAFVDERGAGDLRNPGAALDALKQVRVCDPACGSGAYLLGMLQELLALRSGLFAAWQIDPVTTYQRKLEIIQNNIYGVDIDPFTVNIARLRLWLSLVVEFEGNNPPPLPNLDYKIAVGDSLAAPDPSGGVQGFDWAVEFAEVFADGGFDIVVANPPYVRQELIKEQKPALQKTFPEVYTGTADLYVYFYARAIQILNKGGMLAFISSNKWMRAGYGEKLRMALSSHTQLQTIIDFRDLPLFGAIAYPVIVIAAKQQPINEQVRVWAPATLEHINNVRSAVDQEGKCVQLSALKHGSWSFGGFQDFDLVAKMNGSGKALGLGSGNNVFSGLKTGFNNAFWIDDETRACLIKEDYKSSEIIHPLLVGKDIRRWHAETNNRWIIVTKTGVDMKRYPAIFKHLSQWQSNLEKRSDQGNYWWELRSCEYYDVFKSPKIIFPDIASSTRFTLDKTGTYIDMTAFVIPKPDLYLLGILNSTLVERFIVEVSSQIRGGFLRFKRQYVEQIPIPAAPAAERATIAALAQQCLDTKGQGPQVAQWESEIDERVARLYGLSSADLMAIRGERPCPTIHELPPAQQQ